MKVIFGTLLFLIALVSCGNYELSPREQNSLLIKKIYAEEMKAKGLRAIGFGGAERDGKTTQISLSFKIDEYLDIQKARELIVDSGNTLLEIINSREEDSQYYKEFPVGISIARIMIFGKTDEKNRSKYIEGTILSEGEITYYTNDPDPKIMPPVTVHEESFEEALALTQKEN